MTFFIFLDFPDWKCNSLTFPWPGKFFIFQNFFPDRGNPELSIEANSVDPEQTAPIGAVWAGSTLFAIEAS